MDIAGDKVYLSVIIPAYNEEERIGRTLESVARYLEQQNFSYEIIVVDDGSSDDTANLVLSRAESIRGLRLIRHSPNQGKGWAVRSGMLSARGAHRLFMDADNSTTIDHWSKMQEYFGKGYDVVVSSRHIQGAEIHVRQMPIREILGHTFRLLVRLLFGLSLTDTQNGFKAFTADATNDLFPRQKIKGWAFDVEILYAAKCRGLKVKEVPVSWTNDDQSRLSLFRTPLMLVDLLRIWIQR